eukprot:g5516.t1
MRISPECPRALLLFIMLLPQHLYFLRCFLHGLLKTFEFDEGGETRSRKCQISRSVTSMNCTTRRFPTLDVEGKF